MRIDRRVTDLYNEYVHTSLPRREFVGLSSAGGAPEDQELARDLFAKTDPARIASDAARLAWSRTAAFFDEYLKR